MSDLFYIDIDLSELAPTASNPVTMLETAAELFINGRTTKQEFMSVYSALTFTSSAEVSGMLLIMKDLYNKGKITKSDFVGAFDAHYISWSNAGWDYIETVIECYYDGILVLSDIQHCWSIGDSKGLLLASTSGTSSQTVQLTIVDFNHDTLTTAHGTKSNALLTIGFMMSENKSRDTLDYASSNIRKWCNSECLAALGNSIVPLVKTVQKQTGTTINRYASSPYYSIVTNSERVFIPTSKEFTGITPSRGDYGINYTYWGTTEGGSRYSLYASTGKRSKNVMTASNMGWTSGGGTYYGLITVVTPSNGFTTVSTGSTSGLMPHFCI